MADFIDGGSKVAAQNEVAVSSADPELEQSLGDMSAQTLAQEIKKIAGTNSIPEANKVKEAPKETPKVLPKQEVMKEAKKEAPKKEVKKETKKEAPKKEVKPAATSKDISKTEDKPPADNISVALKQKEEKIATPVLLISQNKTNSTNKTEEVDKLFEKQLSMTTSLDDQIKQLMQPKKTVPAMVETAVNKTAVKNSSVSQKNATVVKKNATVAQKNATVAQKQNTTVNASKNSTTVVQKVASANISKNASANFSKNASVISQKLAKNITVVQTNKSAIPQIAKPEEVKSKIEEKKAKVAVKLDSKIPAKQVEQVTLTQVKPTPAPKAKEPVKQVE